MKLTPADSAEIDTAARKHDTKFADMPRIRRGAIPSPDGYPSKIADDTTAEIIADLGYSHYKAKRVDDALSLTPVYMRPTAPEVAAGRKRRRSRTRVNS